MHKVYKMEHKNDSKKKNCKACPRSLRPTCDLTPTFPEYKPET